MVIGQQQVRKACLFLVLVFAIISLTHSQSPTAVTQARIRINLKLDSHPWDTNFEIRGPAPSNNLIASREFGWYKKPSVQVTEILSLKHNESYFFVLEDRTGDGIQDGFYAIFANDETNDNLLVAGRTNFLRDMTVEFKVPLQTQIVEDPVPLSFTRNAFR